MKYSEFHRWIVGDSSIGRLLVLIFHHIPQMNKFYNPNGFVHQPAPTPRVHHATAPKRHRGPSENAERLTTPDSVERGSRDAARPCHGMAGIASQ